MKPLQIALVENAAGNRRIRWLGVAASALVLSLIAAPMTAIAAAIMGPLPVFMTAVALVGLLASMVRIAYSTPLDQLPVTPNDPHSECV
ncbi:MAG: hypothetical protein AAGD07_24430 [Planctomycetota bacterium]